MLDSIIQDVEAKLDRIKIWNDIPSKEELVGFLSHLKKDLEDVSCAFSTEYVHQDTANETETELQAMREACAALEEKIRQVKEIL